MLSKKLEEALNAQVNAEFWSSYLYLSMSSDFAVKGLPGFANWMNVQFQEEKDHAIKFFNYIISRGGRPDLRPISEVQKEWKSPLEAFQNALEHEQVVTKLINNLYTLAAEDQDYATQSTLKWFIDEQVEEEDNARAIIDKLKMIGDNGYGIYQLDKELALRVYVPIITPAP